MVITWKMYDKCMKIQVEFMPLSFNHRTERIKMQIFAFVSQTRLHFMMIRMQNFVPELRKFVKSEEILGSRYLVKYKAKKKCHRLGHLYTRIDPNPLLMAIFFQELLKSTCILLFFCHFRSS